jgi:putative MATE family efflux protein
MKKGKDLTVGNETKVILKFAVPMMIGNIFQQLYNVVDAAVVGKFVGKAALSATGVSFPILFLLSSLVIGFAIGGTILISQFYGSKQIDKVKITSETLQIVMLLAALMMTILGIAFSRPLFRLLNFPEQNINMAVSYFDILMIGNIGIFGYNSLAAILRGLGDSQTPVYFLIISTIMNIFGDLLFVIVFKMGVQGAAWSTVIAYFIAYLIGIIYLNKKHKIIRVNFRIKFDKKIFRRILKIGLPSSGQMLVVSLGNVMIFSIINLFGTNVIAGYTAAARINSFAIMPAMFFSNALTAFVGQNFGANKIKRIHKGLWSTIAMISITSLTFTFIALIMPQSLMRMFTNDAAVTAVGVQYFKIVAPFYIVFGTMFSFNALYRGIGDTIMPLYFSFIALWIVRFPAAILLSMHINWSPLKLIPLDSAKLWWSEPMGWTVGMLLAAIYYFSKKWLAKANKKADFLKNYTPNN